MRTLIGALAAAGLLAACATPQQGAALERDVDALIQAYGPVCERQGLAVDSRPWRNCVYQSGKQELSDLRGTEHDFPLIHRLGQRLGLIRSNG